MARRKRLTKTKRSRTTGGDPYAPTESEWAAMEPFGSFVVSDQDDEEHVFKVGDIAIILPEHKDVNENIQLSEYWVGKIKQIRIRGSKIPDVWVRVQWYWSPSEVATLIKSFDGSACGNRERLFSDHYDLVSSSCFSGTTTVKKFQENGLEPEDIGDRDFYTRYTLEHKVRKVDPKPMGTCICERPYNQDDGIMHFCPRPACRKSYHRSCLLDAKAKDPNPSDRELRLLACSPDTDTHFSLADLTPDVTSRKRRRNHTAPAPQASVELLQALPPDLVRVAQQPIVKGVEMGITGNVRSVVRARRMVYQAVSGSASVPDDWDQAVGVSGTLSVFSGKRVPAFICPQCKSPI